LDLLSRKNENGEKKKEEGFLHLDLESLERKIEKEFREEC
jgi:hypothetical protein